MHSIRNIFFFTVGAVSIVSVTNSLQESVIDSGILITEEIIRNTTNKLFSSLKLKKNPRLNQYITINRHFASITIQEHDNLKEISRLSRSNTENNESTIFMTAINELLNDDNNIVEENGIKHDVITEKHDDHLADIIETFLKRLRQARELHDVSAYVKINEDVLNIIKEARTLNTTDETEQDDHYMAINTTSGEIDFWKPSGRRIYQGERTKIKHYPFMASIQMFSNFQCAGSIIKSDLVITASSCLQLAWNNRFFRENPAFLAVRVGSSFYSGGGEVISVLEVYFHPSYDPKTLKNNICIVRLSRKIKFSWRARRRVRKIDIDRHASKLPYNTPGITILGWGAKGRSNIVGDPWHNILSYAVLDVYPLRECQEIYSKEYVTHKNFCAGFMSKGGGACNRDIGGPGVDEGTLVGVVSFGSPVCGAADAPTVFTKLGYYADWIDGIMDQKVPFAKKRTTLKPKTQRYTYTTFATTTFKIPPLPGGKTKPAGINEIENVLRLFDDDLFEDFIRTMFDSKEMAEYQDAIKDVKQDMASKLLQDAKNEAEGGKEMLKHKQQTLQNEQILDNKGHGVTSPYIDFETETATKLIEFQAESTETATDSSKYTATIDETSPNSNKLDKNIAELIKNIDLKKIIEEETDAAKKKEAEAVTEPILIDEMGMGFQPEGSKNESVLTLLYLSEENKDKDGEAQESVEEGKGLSIAADSFQDMTRSKGKTIGNNNDLPEKELYEILSEVIDDEIRNNETV